MTSYAKLGRDLAGELAGFLEPEEARAESRVWLEDGLGLSRAWLAAHGADPVPPGQAARIAAWLDRRRLGEPWAYILGWAWFRGRRFRVTPATLIPRPETELVLEAALEVGRRLKILHATDIGTGTGILAISMALETDWEVAATDLSPGALDVARANAAQMGAKVRFQRADLLDAVPDPLGLVVSNPPYVDPADEPTLQRELAFEPRSALFAGDHGLALAGRLLGQAHARMAPACVLEIGSGQGEALQARAKAAGWRNCLVHKDLAGHDRVLMALR
jgi:release factor glutamine methyltransferase